MSWFNSTRRRFDTHYSCGKKLHNSAIERGDITNPTPYTALARSTPSALLNRVGLFRIHMELHMNYDANQQTAGIVGFQKAGYSDALEAPATAGGRVTLAMSRAAEVCGRVEELADRLCGSVPQAVSTVSGQQIKGRGPGVLPQLESDAAELEDYVSRAHSAISRINNCI